MDSILALGRLQQPLIFIGTYELFCAHFSLKYLKYMHVSLACIVLVCSSRLQVRHASHDSARSYPCGKTCLSAIVILIQSYYV